MASEHTVYITEILMYHNIDRILRIKVVRGEKKRDFRGYWERKRFPSNSPCFKVSIECWAKAHTYP